MEENQPKVGGCQTRSFALRDTQYFLEVFVQNIEKPVGETPEEEEDGDQADRNDRLASGDLRGASDPLVVDTFPVRLAQLESFNGRRTTRLVVDIVHDGLCSFPEHDESSTVRPLSIAIRQSWRW